MTQTPENQKVTKRVALYTVLKCLSVIFRNVVVLHIAHVFAINFNAKHLQVFQVNCTSL